VLVLLALGVVAVVAVAVLFGRGSGDYGAAQRAKRIAIILMIGAVVLLAIGFTQFRWLKQSGSAGTVALVLDVSNSMSRDDVAPTRMQAAKEAARTFLDELPEDLAVALVVFSGQPTVLAAPTKVRSTIDDALVGLPRGEGTVIGDGLDTALDSIEERWRTDGKGPAAVVLLSDGRDTGSVISPELAAQRAARLGIPVYTVVVGQDLGESSGADLGLMADIATRTGGEAYTASSASGLIEVYRTIQEKLSTDLAITNFGAWFVGAAGLLALAATFSLLYALRTEAAAGTTKKQPVRRDVPRSRPPRKGRAKATRPRR
jgi:Ca-activated chloride channel homolog